MLASNVKAICFAGKTFTPGIIGLQFRVANKNGWACDRSGSSLTGRNKFANKFSSYLGKTLTITSTIYNSADQSLYFCFNSNKCAVIASAVEIMGGVINRLINWLLSPKELMAA